LTAAKPVAGVSEIPASAGPTFAAVALGGAIRRASAIRYLVNLYNGRVAPPSASGTPKHFIRQDHCLVHHTGTGIAEADFGQDGQSARAFAYCLG